MNIETILEHQRDLENAPKYIFGLDLGQAKDYTALAIIKRTQTAHRVYQFDCVHLQRWALRTSYPNIVADVVKMLHSPSLQRFTKILALDNTGVGAPVTDLFRKEKLLAGLVPIQIVGGDKVSTENGVTRVPKRDLVSIIQVGLQNKTFKIVPSLNDADTLARELSNFTVKITDSANDVYGAWREGTHDDLVLATALALWTAINKTAGYRSNVFRR